MIDLLFSYKLNYHFRLLINPTKRCIFAFMPVKVSIKEPSGTYFITFTCANWLPLIQLTNAYDAVYKWFDTLVKNGHFISGFVIMPNHVHALISFKNNGQSINTIVGNGKRFMAYEIIKRLEAQGETKVLTNLQLGVTAKDRLKNKKHEVWKYSFDWKECHTNEFMLQIGDSAIP